MSIVKHFFTQKLPQKPHRYIRSIITGIGILLLLHLITFLLAEGLWFQEVDYLQVFTTRLYTQITLGVIPLLISLAVLWGNSVVAKRQAWSASLPDGDRPALPGRMRLVRLLPFVLLLSLTIGLVLLHHGQIAVSNWQPNQSVYGTAAVVPLRFRPSAIWQMAQTWTIQLWQPALLGVVALGLLVYPRSLLAAITILTSLSFGLILAEQWTRVLLAFNPVLFNEADPIFGRDIGFYIFTLPFWKIAEFWFVGLSTLTLAAVSLIYLLSGNSISQGYFPGFSAAQQRHLYGLGGFLMLAVALSYWLDRYDLLYAAEGIVYGATYTSITVQLPAYNLLSLSAIGLACFLFWNALSTPSARKRSPVSSLHSSLHSSLPPRSPAPPPSGSSSPLRFILYLLTLYLLIAAIVAFILPPTFQRLVVQPNELQLEQSYLRRAITLTRSAFNLDVINSETFDPENTLTYAALQQNDQTIRNIRLWDTRPLLETNRQLQRIRLYYEFPDADIDRYALPNEQGTIEQQQVLIAARELDYSAVPAAAQTWINKHLIYTHGYGFTMSPVNVTGEGGLPDYLVRGIEPVFAADRVRNSIPIGKPRIYYGEISDTYVMTQTQVRELDYPSGSDNVYNVYDGWGGVEIGSAWRKLLLSKHLLDWRMLLADNFTPKTRLLFRRNINERIRAIAPFLRYDRDPYLVVADTGNRNWERGHDRTLNTNASTLAQSHLYWMIDAYTISDHYPYSDPGANDFNYIRNSVKVVVDAYHGSVNFYVADLNDPVIQSWQRVFPGMFQSLNQMPIVLQQHIRYPQDLYGVQAERLMTYHMTDPVVFYNREDLWRAPNEIYGDQQQPVEPYYLIMKLPTGQEEEFILLQPFTPSQRNNLIAWLAARSDREEYGKMLLYDFPKQKLVYGPEQIEARINQDPVISERISLWNRQGSRALQGNLLVIPIEQSLLYVEPLYLEAELNRLPTLVRVIVAYGSRIAIAETLQKALEAIFEPPASPNPIVRPVEEGTIEEPGLDSGLVPGSLPGSELGTVIE